MSFCIANLQELSGGQRQQKVLPLARAIVREPNVFLMDEPLSNLDAKLRVSTRAQIKHLQHELKVTTIYVTHDQIEAMTLADRVVVMNKGLIQQIGTPTEICDKPANLFVAGFIGNPAMNLIGGRIKKLIFPLKTLVKGLKLKDGPAILGFRAEDAEIIDKLAKAQITAPTYAMELLGDATMVTVKAGKSLVAVKARKEFRTEIGSDVCISVPEASCHLFDSQTGERLGS